MILVVLFTITGLIMALAVSIANSLFIHWYGILIFLLLFIAGFALGFIAFLIICFIATLPVNMSKKVERPNRFVVWLADQIAEFLCIFSGVRIQICGEELIPDNQRFLFISNHRSNMDPIIVMNKLRHYDIAFISKIQNLKIPIVGKLIHLCCFMSIDRENARNAVKTIQQSSDYLKADIVSIGIYPEGTRSKSQKMLPFHAGSFKIAQKGNAPVVVAAVRGTEKIGYKFWRKYETYVDILDVISAEEVRSMKSVDLSEKCRNIIAAFLTEHGENIN